MSGKGIWHKVMLGTGDAWTYGPMLLMQYEAAWRANGMPTEAEVWTTWSPDGDKVYYFSPMASAIASPFLRHFLARAVQGQPDLRMLKRVALPAGVETSVH